MLNFNTNAAPSSNNIMRYRSDSALKGTGVSYNRADSQAVFHFANELIKYDPKEYEAIKNELSWADLFSIRTDIAPGADVFSYTMYDSHGESKFSANKAKDIPLVGATGKQYTSRFGNIDVAMEFTAQDINAASFARKDIIGRLRAQTMRSNFEAINKCCFEGYAPLEIPGLLNNPHLTSITVADGANGTNKKLWSNKTADEIFKDLIDGYNAALAQTGNNIRPNTLIMSQTAYNDISTRIFNNFNGTTVLQQIKNMTNVEVKGIPELNGIFQGTSKNGFIFFKNDPEYVEQLLPVMFDTTAPQQEGWTYTVYCRSRYGGVIIRQPKMFVLRHGI